MTILSIIQEVCKVTGLDVPTDVLASTEREHIELVSLANEMAERIAQSYDWQVLKNVATVNGDGLTESFDLPSDYRRMLKKSQLWSSSSQVALTPVPDADSWLGMGFPSVGMMSRAWTLYGGQLHIKPALASSATAQYFYISRLIVTSVTDANKAEFTADDDVFRLSERLLKLGMVWQWRASKGLAYQEDMDTYEHLKEQLVCDDKGSRSIRLGRVLDVDTTEYQQGIEP